MNENKKPTYFAVKSMFPAEHMETTNRIDWCNESDITFFTQGIRGTKVGEIFYDEHEMKKIGVLDLKDDNGNTGEIDLSTLPPINIGMAFVFHNEIDASAFKLRWV